MEYELLIREAEAEDAAELVTFFKSCEFGDRFYQPGQGRYSIDGY